MLNDVTQSGYAIRRSAIAPLSSKGATASGKKRSDPPICESAHCHITHHWCFYVASLRRCVRPSFSFLTMLHVHSMGKYFLSHATAQRRNVKSYVMGLLHAKHTQLYFRKTNATHFRKRLPQPAFFKKAFDNAFAVLFPARASVRRTGGRDLGRNSGTPRFASNI